MNYLGLEEGGGGLGGCRGGGVGGVGGVSEIKMFAFSPFCNESSFSPPPQQAMYSH